jgi:NAD-dependent SIR2 family protein deacetylase
MSRDFDDEIRRAAAAVRGAEAILITAGAGMGVDSGLPDFRGTQGFWRAYPPYAQLGLDFASVANPAHFRRDPAFGWGFYGHRTNLYRRTAPHEGFATLQRWASPMPGGSFVFTSNVDGHFARAGFDPERILECHGSIEYRQCLLDCGVGLFPADPDPVAVDETTFRALEPFPSCPQCGALARPNILMFGDGEWDSRRADEQAGRLKAWLRSLGSRPLVVVELGAGRVIPTVRQFSEDVSRSRDSTLIRINPRDFDVPGDHIGLPVGALEGLRAIDARIGF